MKDLVKLNGLLNECEKKIEELISVSTNEIVENDAIKEELIALKTKHTDNI